MTSLTLNYDQAVSLCSGQQPVMKFLGFFFWKRLFAVRFYDSRHIMTGVGGVPAHLGDSLQCKLADLRDEAPLTFVHFINEGLDLSGDNMESTLLISDSCIGCGKCVKVCIRGSNVEMIIEKKF